MNDIDVTPETRALIAAALADPILKPTLSVEEFAGLAEISPDTAYRGIKDGTIPCVRFGRRIRIPTAAAAKLLGLDAA